MLQSIAQRCLCASSRSQAKAKAEAEAGDGGDSWFSGQTAPPTRFGIETAPTDIHTKINYVIISASNSEADQIETPSQKSALNIKKFLVYKPGVVTRVQITTALRRRYGIALLLGVHTHEVLVQTNFGRTAGFLVGTSQAETIFTYTRCISGR